MAIIGKIRSKSWILIIMMFLGLASFILMDMLSGKTSVFGGSSQLDAGSVNGKNISWSEFQRTESVLSQNSRSDAFQRRSAIWDFFVEKAIVDNEADGLGLVVSKDELLELEFGQNLSPVVQNRFTNPQTRQVNRENLNQYKKAIEENTLSEPAKQFWRVQEEQIIKDRLQTKLSSMVEKAMFTPSWMVEELEKEQNKNISFNYVKVPFDAVANTEVTVTDADLSKYLNSHKAEFTNKEETRKVDYVSFTIKPSAKDSSNILSKFSPLKADFRSSTNDSLFVAINSGIMTNGYLTKDKITIGGISEQLFTEPVGTVFGPYVDRTNYQLTKLQDRRVLPDSAKSRIILIQAQSPDQFVAANKTIDSLLQLINSGTDFAELAKKHSQDPTSAGNGGDYNYVALNQVIPAWQDLIFFKGQIGKVYKVTAPYGVQLVEPQGRKGEEKEYVKIASITQSIIPSDETIADVFDKASKFINENKTLDEMKASAQNMNLFVKSSAPLKKNDFIVGELGSSQSSRDIVKWAFQNSVGTISPSVYSFEDPVNYYTNKYVVAGLRSIQSAGLPSVANIKEELMPLVMNLKKGEILKGKITSKDLNSIASTYGTQVDSATDIKFSSSFVPGMGTEPKVIAKALTLAQNVVSNPIVGENGVYIVNVTSNQTSNASSNVGALRKVFNSKYTANIKSQLIKSIKDNAEISDNRSTYY